MESHAVKPTVAELASRIYVDLVSRSTTISEHGVKLSASAENIAKLSFGLAHVFFAYDDVDDESRPKTGFDMGKVDLANWGGKAK
jgi:hypothetical protein